MEIDYKKQGKKNKAAGARFEKKIREHFIGEGWMVDKWSNNIDLESEEVVATRNHYMPGRGCTLGHGFPDFVMFKHSCPHKGYFDLMFIECKKNGFLRPEEKEKCRILQELGCKVFIAYEDVRMPYKFRLREFVYSEKREVIPRG